MACSYLLHSGFRIVDRNWRCKAGEIDIIGINSDGLYFFEVKYRKNSDFGEAYEALNWRKLQKLRKAIELYLLASNYKGFWQLDGLCLYLREGRLRLRRYQNLFSEI